MEQTDRLKELEIENAELRQLIENTKQGWAEAIKISESRRQLIEEMKEGLEYAVRKMPLTSENLKLNKTKLEKMIAKASSIK